MSSAPSPPARTDTTPAFVDPRGPRFGAWVTTVVLAIVVLTGNGWLLAAQTLVFLTAAVLGLGRAPYGWLYRALVRPRLGSPAELEAAAPPRFAQAVGAIFGLVGTVGFATGLTALGLTATAFALAAAFLNAAFGFCLGCEVYLLGRRALGRAALVRFVPTLSAPNIPMTKEVAA